MYVFIHMYLCASCPCCRCRCCCSLGINIHIFIRCLCIFIQNSRFPLELTISLHALHHSVWGLFFQLHQNSIEINSLRHIPVRSQILNSYTTESNSLRHHFEKSAKIQFRTDWPSIYVLFAFFAKRLIVQNRRFVFPLFFNLMQLLELRLWTNIKLLLWDRCTVLVRRALRR